MTQRNALRRFDPTHAEYEAIVRVYNRANPHEPGSAPTWKHWDQHRDPAGRFTRYVVERQGEIGAYGFSVRTDIAANKFRFDTYYLPQWETAGLIDQFGRYVMDQCLEFKPAAFISRAREDEEVKSAWLDGLGFERVMRYPRSTLDVSGFEPSGYTELKARVAGQGLEIVSLVELAQRDTAWQRRVYELEMLLAKDVPRPSEFSPPPFDKYAKTEFDAPDFMPDLWLVALAGDAYVGMTSLFKPGDNLEMLESGLTGVRRDFRRRGLAMTLKCQAIEIAQGMGVRVIQTYNEENNPMFHLNLRLGFEAQPADVDWEKDLAGG